jgi:hypothetical protein
MNWSMYTVDRTTHLKLIFYSADSQVIEHA